MRKNLIITVLVGLLSVTRCGQPADEKELVPEKSRTFTSLSNEEGLSRFKENMDVRTSISGRTSEDFASRVNWSKIYRVDNAETDLVTFTIPLLSTDKRQFENLIIVQDENLSFSYIIRYSPDPEWLKVKPRRGGMSSYTGLVEIISLEGELKASSVYESGRRVKEEISSGRISADGDQCEIFMDVTWTEVCVEGYGCTITEVNWVEYEVCSPGGGGSGSNPGNPGSGDTGGSDPGDPSGGGGTGPTPIGGGDPGFVDPVDLSYYLTPVLQGDDLSNPYDGMKAVDENGVVYTYDATLDAWLLPDLLVLSEEGYNLLIDDAFEGNGFDGAILSTVTTIALIEPTPIGEVVVGGAILIILAYEWSQFESSQIDDGLRDHCSDMFYLCSTRYGYKNMDCAGCQRYCNVQGYWDFDTCPLRD